MKIVIVFHQKSLLLLILPLFVQFDLKGTEAEAFLLCNLSVNYGSMTFIQILILSV